MKKSKKILSVLLSLMMIISIIPMSTITASADAGVSVPEYDGKELVFGDYEYAVVSEIEKTCLIEEYRGTDTEVIIPSEINGYSVIELYAKSFYGIESTSITIPNTVLAIDNGAFYSCSNLTSITIPDSVITIGFKVFYYCDNLSNITIGNSVKTIGYNTFDTCHSLTNITVNSNNEHFSSDEYGVLFNKDKTSLIQYPIGNTRTNYIIPDSVTSIDKYAFSGCTSLTSVTIPDSVVTIGEVAFSSCENLTSVTFPNSITSIDKYAFSSCTSLTSVTIPDNVETIGEHAFAYCDKLENVAIGNGVTSIGNYAFILCDNLTNVTINSNNPNYSNDEYGVLFNKNKTTIIQYPAGNTRTNYIIPDSVTTISDWAFSSCKSLMSVTLGDSVTTIGESAFISCWGLTNIVFPDSLSTIEDSAFEFCHYLNDVHYSGTEDNWNSITIGNENYDLTGATIHFNCEGQYTETIINPTCVNDGKKTYSCDCGIYREEEIPALGHSFENDVCSVCGVSINHYYCEYEVTDHKNATCYEDGYTTYTCKECGYYYTDVIYAYHDFGEGVVVEEATCTKDGYGTQTCTICGFTETYDIYVGHEYGDWVVTIEPTCTTEGEETHTCINCGNSESKTIGIRHNYGDTVIVTEPTCTTEGETKTTCTECGYFYTGSIPIKHNYQKVAEGQFECTECKKINTKYIELVASDYDAKVGDTITVELYTRNCTELSCLTLDIIYDNTALEIVDYKNYQFNIINPNLSSNTIRCLAYFYNYTEDNPDISITFKVLNAGGEISFEIEEAVDDDYQRMDIVNAGPLKIGEKLVSEDGIIVIPENDDTIPENTELNILLFETKEDSITYDITLTNNGAEIQPNGNVTVKIPVPNNLDRNNLSVYRAEEDGTYTDMNAVFEDGYMVFVTDHFSKYIVTTKDLTTPDTPEYNYTFSIQSPSRTEIRNKDGIILHGVVDGTAPTGSYVRWESSNGNFDKSADGSNLKIVAKNKGWTTFTAILCDADGNELARDSVEMYSKSGFFDKIGGFFRGLFGLTKIYEN